MFARSIVRRAYSAAPTMTAPRIPEAWPASGSKHSAATVATMQAQTSTKAFLGILAAFCGFCVLMPRGNTTDPFGPQGYYPCFLLGHWPYLPIPDVTKHIVQ